MDAGRHAHGHLARVVAYELLVDIQYAFQLRVQNRCGDMGNVQVHHVLSVDAQVLVHAYVEDFARGNIAWHQIAVRGILFFQEIPRLSILVGPDPAAFAARRFAHQAVFIEAGNCSGMDLDELAVGVERSLLVATSCSVAGVDGGVG